MVLKTLKGDAAASVDRQPRKAAQAEVKQAIQEVCEGDAASCAAPAADFATDFAEFARQVQAASVAYRLADGTAA